MTVIMLSKLDEGLPEYVTPTGSAVVFRLTVYNPAKPCVQQCNLQGWMLVEFYFEDAEDDILFYITPVGAYIYSSSELPDCGRRRRDL